MTLQAPIVVFKVKYLCNGWVKKDGVNANLVYDWPNFSVDILNDFAFSPRLSVGCYYVWLLRCEKW